jgi:predicted transcriptional regulator
MDNFSKGGSKKQTKDVHGSNEGRIEYELELLQRHAQILNIIVNNEPIGIIRLSNLSKFPQHKVRYSLRILEQEGLIEPSPDGAITTEQFKIFIPKINNILSVIKKTIQEIKSSVKK